MKIAAVQMISTPDVATNLATAGRLIAEAAGRGARLVALPEYFPLIGASDADRLAAREGEGEGPIQAFLAEAARQHGIWLVGGSIPLAAHDPAKLRNSTLVFTPQGQRVARYDKVHLFGFTKGAEHYDESVTIEAGATPVAFDAENWRVGLTLEEALRVSVDGLGTTAAEHRRLAPDQLEVAVLDRARPRRKFKRLTTAQVSDMLPEAAPDQPDPEATIDVGIPPTGEERETEPDSGG